MCSKTLSSLSPAQISPDFFGGKAENGRKQAHQTVRDVVQRALRRAPGTTLGAAVYKPVLENVQIEATQVLGTESVQSAQSGETRSVRNRVSRSS